MGKMAGCSRFRIRTKKKKRKKERKSTEIGEFI